MIPYEKQLEQFSQVDKNSLTFIVGDKGLGKSYFIHKPILFTAIPCEVAESHMITVF